MGPIVEESGHWIQANTFVQILEQYPSDEPFLQIDRAILRMMGSPSKNQVWLHPDSEKDISLPFPHEEYHFGKNHGVKLFAPACAHLEPVGKGRIWSIQSRKQARLKVIPGKSPSSHRRAPLPMISFARKSIDLVIHGHCFGHLISNGL